MEEKAEKSVTPAKRSGGWWVVLVIIAIVTVSWALITLANGGNQGAVADKRKDLDLTIRGTTEGLEISNNEEGQLVNCTVRVNKKYSAKMPVIGNEKGLIAYSGLTTDDGERFNILTHKVNDVVVELCSNAGGRIGIYGT